MKGHTSEGVIVLERGEAESKHTHLYPWRGKAGGFDWTPGQAGGQTEKHREWADRARGKEQCVRWLPFTETVVTLSMDHFLFARTCTPVIFWKINKSSTQELQSFINHLLSANATLRLHCNSNHLLNLKSLFVFNRFFLLTDTERETPPMLKGRQH